MKSSDNIAENLEQSQETVEPAHVVSRADLTAVHRHASMLMDALQDVPDGDIGEQSRKFIQGWMDRFATLVTATRSATAPVAGPPI